MKKVASVFLSALFAIACVGRAVAAPGVDELLGSWKLVGIDFTGPKGPLPDPVFGPDPHGLIIYDRTGWVSVQIYSAGRPKLSQPASRTSGAVPTEEEARIKAAAMDTYYAYFGTWKFDAAASTITHHIQNSLLPYEIGRDLKRDVKLDGNHLSLTVEIKAENETCRRVLRWERIENTIQ